MSTIAFITMPQGWELLLIFLAILLIFGPKNLPKLGRMLGDSIKEFRKATNNAAQGDEPAGREPDKISEKPVAQETAHREKQPGSGKAT